MKSKTHIFILHMKEIIYTVIFAALAVVLIILLIYMFGRKNNSETMVGVSQFSPGIYNSSLVLGSHQLELQVSVDENGIEAVSFSQLDDAVKSMYPLLETCMEDINNQLQEGIGLQEIAYPQSNQYTSSLLIEAINNALQKAAP